MLNALRKGGSITFSRLNKQRTLERKDYTCICAKCGKEYTVTCTEHDYNKGNYKKYCSRSCANSRVVSDEQKQKVSQKLKEQNKNKVKIIKDKTDESNTKAVHLQIIKTCKNCGKELSHPNKSKTGYCSICSHKFRKISDETRDKLRQAGLHSAAV